ncbi:MAG: CCA tRNA nucleotidyltransferase [Planctomycetota bacterium]
MSDRERARAVARRLLEAGHQALFAGGCVRDRLRGADPTDYDIATSARPDEVVELFERTVPVGAAFGVILVVEGERTYEVATFREDVGIADGRHPKRVKFGSAREDALRRDFTINGMFEDPQTEEILDFVGGERDLEAGLVRSIGTPADRFREDYLRVLRAVRFATCLDFVIEAETLRAVSEQAQGVRKVSAERIRDELTRILLSGRGGRGVGLMLETGLLELILPEVAALDGVPQPALFHPEGDALTHTRMLLDSFEGEGGAAVALAALLHDIGKAPTLGINEKKGRIAFPNHAPLGAEMAVEVMRRLRYPGSLIEQVEILVARHMDWKNLPDMRAAKQRRFLLRDDFHLHLELHRLDCEASHRDLAIHRFATDEVARLETEPPPERPLLDGHRLMELGFAQGPCLGRILHALMDAQLEGAVRDREAAEEFVLRRFARPDGRPIAEGDDA